MSGALAVLNRWGQGLLESWEPREQENRDVCTVGGSWGDAGLCLQMYGSQDGDIDEDTLSSILKTALGVAELSVTSLFQAIDQEGAGRITFGEWPRGGGGGPCCTGGVPRRWDTGTKWKQCPRVLARTRWCLVQREAPGRKILPQARQGLLGDFESDLCGVD